MTRLIPMPTCRGKMAVAGELDCGHFVWIREPAQARLAYRIRDPYCLTCERLCVPIQWWQIGD